MGSSILGRLNSAEKILARLEQAPPATLSAAERVAEARWAIEYGTPTWADYLLVAGPIVAYWRGLLVGLRPPRPPDHPRSAPDTPMSFDHPVAAPLRPIIEVPPEEALPAHTDELVEMVESGWRTAGTRTERIEWALRRMLIGTGGTEDLRSMFWRITRTPKPAPPPQVGDRLRPLNDHVSPTELATITDTLLRPRLARLRPDLDQLFDPRSLSHCKIKVTEVEAAALQTAAYLGQNRSEKVTSTSTTDRTWTDDYLIERVTRRLARSLDDDRVWYEPMRARALARSAGRHIETEVLLAESRGQTPTMATVRALIRGNAEKAENSRG